MEKVVDNVVKKVVVYLANRPYYEKLLPSLRSLITYNRSLDEIIIVGEDDEYPYKFPSSPVPIRMVNINPYRKYIKKTSPNERKTFWPTIILLRCAYPKIFKDYDQILTLDVDTVVCGDITGLWDIDLGDYYYAACKETQYPPEKSWGHDYFNIGVAMLNLRKLRDDKMDVQILKDINETWYEVMEQDCYCHNCWPKILRIPSVYNVAFFTEPHIGDPKIIHLASNKNWFDDPLVKEWKRKTKWEK